MKFFHIVADILLFTFLTSFALLTLVVLGQWAGIL
jgi:hypothetical protein